MSRTQAAYDELTQQLREYAEEKGVSTEEAVAAGLAEKADEFRSVSTMESDGALVQLGRR